MGVIKKIIYSLLIFYLLLFFVNAQDNLRDPFIPLIDSQGRILIFEERNLDVGDLHLEGIIYSDTQKMAIINGEIFQEGNFVFGYYLKFIREKEVVLEKQDKEYILKWEE